MKRQLKSVISGLLALVMILAAIPAIATAAEGDVNLALGKDIIQYNSIADGNTDPQGVKDPTTGAGFRQSVAEQVCVDLNGMGTQYEGIISGNRLTDGIVNGHGDYTAFEEDWVNSKWTNPDAARGRYINCYRNDARDLILDLGAMSNIHSISMHVGSCTPYGIEAPLQMTYYVSETVDGPYYLVGTSYRYEEGSPYSNLAVKDENAVSTVGEEPPMDNWYFTVDGLDVNARYVRVCFDVNVWAFIDELEVLGSETVNPSAPNLSGDIWKPETVYNYFPTSGSEDPVDNHEVLAYTGWYLSGDKIGGETNKTVEEFRQTVGYVLEDGSIKDWLFENVTFLGHGVSADKKYDTYRHGENNPADYATKETWDEWFDHIFGTTSEIDTSADAVNLDALEQAAGLVKEALGDDTTKVGVKISIVPPVHIQNNWGDGLDFTMAGHNYNMDDTIADRMVAMKWQIDEIIRRFSEKNYQNIVLTGFYYHDETIRSTQDAAAGKTIQAINEYIHERGYVSYQIPFYQSEGYKKWEDFGFDYAIQQPNYVFQDDAPANRVDTAAELSKKYGLGVEIEWRNKDTDAKFIEYLSKGTRLGFREARTAWYFGTWDLPYLCSNPGYATHRYLYDATYQYLNGQDPVLEPNILKGTDVTLVAENVNADLVADVNTYISRILTNGFYAEGWDGGSNGADKSQIAFNVNNNAGPYEVISNLGGYYELSKVFIDFFTWPSAGVGSPDEIVFSVSMDGENWKEIGSITDPTETTDFGNGTGREKFVMNVSNIGAKYLKATFTGGTRDDGKTFGWVSFDEFGAVGKAADEPDKPVIIVDLSKNILTEEMLTLEYGGMVEGQDGNYATVTRDNNAYKGLLADKKLSGGWSYAGWPNPYCNYMTYNCGIVTGDMTITADLGRAYDISLISMNFVDLSQPMHPASVDFEISDDGETWTQLASLTDFSRTPHDDANPKYSDCAYTIETESTARYVRAVFRGQPGGWMATDEFTVIGTPVAADMTALEEAVAAAKELVHCDYTEETWIAFQAALEEAEAVLADEAATQETVDAAVEALAAAVEALEEGDHRYGEWVDTEDGEHHKCICSVCGATLTAAHTWDEGEVTKEPTETETGVKTYTCEDCGAVKTEEIPCVIPEPTEPEETEPTVPETTEPEETEPETTEPEETEPETTEPEETEPETTEPEETEPETTEPKPTDPNAPPQTGDTAPVMLWLLLSVGSLMGIAVVAFFTIQKRYQGKF